jgi:hypothetical protein
MQINGLNFLKVGPTLNFPHLLRDMFTHLGFGNNSCTFPARHLFFGKILSFCIYFSAHLGRLRSKIECMAALISNGSILDSVWTLSANSVP